MVSTRVRRETHPWVAAGHGRVRFGICYNMRPDWFDWSVCLRYAQLSEQLGADSFWLADHPGLFGADPWTALTVLARETQRMRLGPLVNCIYYRHPVLVARMAADVDRLSGGRLMLGLGIGDVPAEFAQLGLPYPPVSARQEALEEAIQLILGAWSGEPFTFAGKHFQTTGAQTKHGPVQQPWVPILIAGGGERVTLRQVAQYADVTNFGPHALTGSAWGAGEVRQKYDVLRRHCETLAREYESIARSHFTMFMALAEDQMAAEAKYNALPEHVRRYWPTGVVVGTPDRVRTAYQELVDAGVEYFILNLNGDEETLRLFAERILPGLRV